MFKGRRDKDEQSDVIKNCITCLNTQHTAASCTQPRAHAPPHTQYSVLTGIFPPIVFVTVTDVPLNRKYAKAETLMTVTDPVHDIAFAPNLGRSFHVLAIATKDVRIFKLVPLR